MISSYFQVLVIGDCEIAGGKLSDYLAQLVWKVHKAEKADKVLSTITTTRPSLIFLNMTSKVFKGYELLAAIRGKHQGIPIIVILDRGDAKGITKCMESGANDFVLKPLLPTIVKQRVDSLAVLKGLADVAAAMTHDLMAPLTSIKGYTDLLTKKAVGPLNEQQTEFLGYVSSNTTKLGKMLRNFNDMIKVETKHAWFSPRNITLPDFLEGVAKNFEERIKQKEQTLKLSVSEKLPTVWCDEQRLDQILAILMDNAHQYTPKGGHITLSAHTQAEKKMVEIRVKDDGMGVLEKEHDRVFQSFFRSEQDKVQEQAGFGLNLYIAKGMVELQGGTMWFENVPGKGMTFHFTLSVAKTE